jgi:hypothetical protein
MKNIFTTCLLCIIICILYSSCSSDITIVKRHYTKGYYIEVANHSGTVTRSKTGINTLESKQIPPINSLLYTASPPADWLLNQNPLGYGNGNASIKKKMPVNKTTHLPITVVQVQKLSLNDAPDFQEEQSLIQASEYHGGGGERAALSLLWIVILVILILWLLGILSGGFGLGGLINVLLVVALILLILWLLRII